MARMFTCVSAGDTQNKNNKMTYKWIACLHVCLQATHKIKIFNNKVTYKWNICLHVYLQGTHSNVLLHFRRATSACADRGQRGLI